MHRRALSLWPGEARREPLRSDVRPGGDAWVAAIKCPKRKKQIKKEKACNVSVVEKAKTCLESITGALVFTNKELSSMRCGWRVKAAKESSSVLLA